MSRFFDRLRKATGYIWDFDTFNEWQNQNTSNYQGGKDKYTEKMNALAEFFRRSVQAY